MSAEEGLIPQQERPARRPRENLSHLRADERDIRRRLANQASARASREREKDYIKNLESEVEKLIEENVELKSRVNFLKTLQKYEELVTAEDSESDYGVMNFDMPNMDINFLAEFDVETYDCQFRWAVNEQLYLQYQQQTQQQQQPQDREQR
eukprot:scpid110086/ scgid9385/ 